MTRCIWCKEVGAPSIEHIFPEALGCPPEFILSGGVVCRACNNGLAHLDQAIIDDFDIIAYMNNVPRKKGRPPKVQNRGNMIATKSPGGNEISINMESYPVTAHDGSRLGPFRNSTRNIQASLKSDGPVVNTSYSTSIGQNPKFVRGIVKIALSSLAYFLGGETALSDEFDPARTFVRTGKGNRPILLMESTSTNYRNYASPPFQSETGEYVVGFRLAVIDFIIDLSPNIAHFPVIKSKMVELYGDAGWTYLPIDY